jgi:predicted ribosome quality control (RQC) complex YloA/Tae2 family protein
MKIQKPTVLDAARLAAELNRFKGAFIEQVLADKAQSHLCLVLKKPDLILSFMVEKGYANIALTESIPDKLEKLARALMGYAISGASQLSEDRIVALDLVREDRLGRAQHGKLILEIIPSKGNAYLIDDSGSVKWALKKKDVGQYHPPPKLHKATALNLDIEKMKTIIQKTDQIADEIFGLNVRDLLNLRLENYKEIEPALMALKQYAISALKPGPAWVIYKDDEVVGYSLLSPVMQSGESAQKCESALEMYEGYYSQVVSQSSEQDRLESLQKILDKEIARERGKAQSIQKELTNAASAQTFLLYGELILSNIDSIKRGAKAAHLLDFDNGQMVDIELDPSKPASANAEDYFKRAKKTASSLNILATRLESTQKKIAQLETIKINSGNNTEALETELTKINLLARISGPPKKKIVERRLPYKKFRSSSGWEIWVGRANTDNDELTFKIARKDDYWFHAWQAAGSHTVLRPPDKHSIPDKQTLLEAASLAAYFSKARNSSKVPVAYTQVKFVHKPRNFPPGKVLVEKEKQLMVKPADPEIYMIKEEE